MKKDNGSAAGAAPVDLGVKAPDALRAALSRARRRHPNAFICQAERIVTNDARCEHCGQDARGICGELPIVMERQAKAASAMLAALEQMAALSDHDVSSAGIEGLEGWKRGWADLRAAMAAAKAAGIRPSASGEVG